MSNGASPRVILSLQGGLGNQLFQWAFATSLRQQGARIRLDTVRCRGARPMALGELAADLPRVPRLIGLALVAAQRAGALRGGVLPSLVAEQGFGYDATARTRATRGGQAGGYLYGYFQSYKYFHDVAALVREQVTAFLSDQLTPAGLALRSELAADPASVALHVRRGDYVTNPAATAHHGVLEPDYYRRALDTLTAAGHTRRVWFSDDLPWVQEHLADPEDQMCPAGVASGAGGEIALMVACSARVIANSSFSWWAGWLGREGSAVMAPARWFAGDDTSVDDMLPAEWSRL